MSEHDRRLIDLKPWEHFDGLLLAVADKKIRKTRDERPFLLLKLRDRTGECNARWFNVHDGVLDTLQDARLVRLCGQMDGSDKFFGDLKLTHVEPAEEPEDLSPWLPPLPGQHAAHKARFFDLIRSVSDPHLKALLESIFNLHGETWARFELAPAAKSMHHAYAGGLLEHSGEVALLCDRVAATIPIMNRDLLVTAALLHDIGKLEEMESGLSCGEYTPVGQLVGHVVLGTCTVASAAERLENFPARLKHEVMHLILSHHGRPEWGAAREPICAEAMVLSLCDQLSAKVAQCHQLAEQNAGELFVRAPALDGGQLYLGLMKEVLAARATPPSE